MKRLLQGRSRRQGHDGWALMVRGAKRPMAHTVCTTREEARDLRREPPYCERDLFERLEVVKVRITVEVVGG